MVGWQGCSMILGVLFYPDFIPVVLTNIFISARRASCYVQSWAYGYSPGAYIEGVEMSLCITFLIAFILSVPVQPQGTGHLCGQAMKIRHSPPKIWHAVWIGRYSAALRHPSCTSTLSSPTRGVSAANHKPQAHFMSLKSFF